MIAFDYVDRFDELADLPRLKKLEVLEIAHSRVLKARRNLVNVAICIIWGLVVGIIPRMFFEMPGAVEGLLFGLGLLVAMQYFRSLYATLLHKKVKELVRPKLQEDCHENGA